MLVLGNIINVLVCYILDLKYMYVVNIYFNCIISRCNNMHAEFICKLRFSVHYYTDHDTLEKLFNVNVLLNDYDFSMKKCFIQLSSDPKIEHNRRHGRNQAVTSTEFNDGNTQYESLTEGHTKDVSPQQG